MAKFTETSTLREVISDPEGKAVIKKAFPLALMHPRFQEGLDYNLREVIEDNMGAMVGIPNEKVKAVIEQLYSL